mmetsp:Transcript_62256/g.111264  ORF Transcript_62256/g.111264 Transcript_62256/m.111264 type:complete len:251 (+) Transcript_62256:2-754(+)
MSKLKRPVSLLHTARRDILVHLLEANQLLKDVLQDVLGSPSLTKLLSHSEDLASLSDVEIKILVCALVRELCKSHPLRCKLLVKVEQVKRRGRRLTETWRKDRWLERWHWSLELRRYQRERLMLNAQLIIKFDCLRDEVCVKLKQAIVKELREITRQSLILLQAAPQVHGQALRVRDVVVLAELGLLPVGEAQVAVTHVEQPLQQRLEDILVLLKLKEVIVQHPHRAHDADSARALVAVYNCGDGSIQWV